MPRCTRGSSAVLIVVVAALLVLGAAPATSQTIDPYYAGSYAFADLGSVPGVPPLYGGLVFHKDDPNLLLIGGNANDAPGALWSVGVVRDGANHVIGFSGPATRYADAAYNDGGVVYGPDGVLFLARWPVNELGQTVPGSGVTDKVIDTAALGVAGSLSALGFVPAGFPGAGSLKLVTYGGGSWYDAAVTPDGFGTFDLSGVTNIAASTLPFGPEGFVFVPTASPLFGTHSILVAGYAAGRLDTYELDSNGDPIVASARPFMTGLGGAEGATLDPLTGDFLFSTFGGGDRVLAVRGFAPAEPPDDGVVPEPGAVVLALASIASGLPVLRRRRQ